ncbi:MAG: hypothetical protein HY319_12980 [Armatimonadetes bacterium]|nr:hypothetical protein [Armatimonadota bacterium]
MLISGATSFQAVASSLRHAAPPCTAAEPAPTDVYVLPTTHPDEAREPSRLPWAFLGAGALGLIAASAVACPWIPFFSPESAYEVKDDWQSTDGKSVRAAEVKDDWQTPTGTEWRSVDGKSEWSRRAREAERQTSRSSEVKDDWSVDGKSNWSKRYESKDDFQQQEPTPSRSYEGKDDWQYKY